MNPLWYRVKIYEYNTDYKCLCDYMREISSYVDSRMIYLNLCILLNSHRIHLLYYCKYYYCTTLLLTTTMRQQPLI